jgi:hypothetical protein
MRGSYSPKIAWVGRLGIAALSPNSSLLEIFPKHNRALSRLALYCSSFKSNGGNVIGAEVYQVYLKLLLIKIMISRKGYRIKV